MATSNVEDSQAEKKRRLDGINYLLCLKCQKPGGTLVKEPETQSYERFLDCTKQRAVYGDLDYVYLNEMLQNVPVDELGQNKATWHKECYKSTTNKTTIQRLSVRYEKSLSSGNVLPPASKGRPRGSNPKSSSGLDESTSDLTGHFHRSSASAYNKEDCFFCGCNDPAGLHQIRSRNAGNQLRAAVEASGNMQWKVQLSSALDPSDAHAYDIKYHLYCWVKHVQRGAQGDDEKNDDATATTEMNLQVNALQLSAEIEFYALLNDLMKSGAVVSVEEAHDTYHTIHILHKVTDHSVSWKQLKAMISSHVPNVEFCRSPRLNEPERICSRKTKDAAVENVTEHQKLTKDLHAIFDCSKAIQEEILDAHKNDPWTFTGTLDTDKPTPQLLKTMLRWIITGPVESLTNEDRDLQVNKAVDYKPTFLGVMKLESKDMMTLLQRA